MRDLKTEQSKLQSRYRLHLNRLKDRYHLYDKELALLMGFGVDQSDLVRKLRSGDAEIHTCDMITLSHNLIREHKDYSILNELVPDGFIAVVYASYDTNGSLDDELRNIAMYSGKIIEEDNKEEKDKDKNKIVDYAHHIGRNVATLKEEVK